jgi:phosphate-selective porin OprO/OprP
VYLASVTQNSIAANGGSMMNINKRQQTFDRPKNIYGNQWLPLHSCSENSFSRLKKALILVGIFGSGLIPISAAAEATTEVAKPGVVDAQARIQELERQMQQISEQLKAVQAQLARSDQNDAQRDAALDNALAKPAVVAKPASGSPVEASFKNGLVFRDATGDWSLRLYTRAQLDYRNFSPDKVAADTFSMRRARIGLFANFYEDFTLRIEGEYSEAAMKMNDGYLDYTHFKPAMIRIGQFKTMHGLERSQGAMDLNFMERAMTESLLGNVFDRGIMLHGAPLQGTYYNMAYVNGTGQNVDESNAATDGKDWSLRVVGNMAQWAGWKDSVVHVGGFHSQGKQAKDSAVPTLRTEGRGVTFFSTTNSNKFDSEVDRTLNGFESAIAYGPVKYQGEYIRTDFDGANFNRDMSAWYASLQWLVTGEQYAGMYKNGAFGGIVPKSNFRYGNGGWGALEIGARYTHFDASDFVVANNEGTGKLATGSTNEADAWTLGAKWILNPNAQIQLNYVRTDFDTPITTSNVDHEDAMNMRVQFDF